MLSRKSLKIPLSLWNYFQSPHLCSSAASQAGNESEPAKTFLQILSPPKNPWDALEGTFTLSRGKRGIDGKQSSAVPSVFHISLSLQDICSGAEVPPELSCCHEVMSPIYDINGCYGGRVEKKNFLFYCCLKGIIQRVPDQKHRDLGMCL